MKVIFATNLIKKIKNKTIQKMLKSIELEEANYNNREERWTKKKEADALYNLGISYNNLGDALDKQHMGSYAIPAFSEAVLVANAAFLLYQESAESSNLISACRVTLKRIKEFEINLDYLKEKYNQKPITLLNKTDEDEEPNHPQKRSRKIKEPSSEELYNSCVNGLIKIRSDQTDLLTIVGFFESFDPIRREPSNHIDLGEVHKPN